MNLDDMITTRRRPQRGTGDFMWRTADGDVVNMYDMSAEHRENAMNLCRRRGNSGKLAQLEQVQREMEKVKRYEPEDIPFPER